MKIMSEFRYLWLKTVEDVDLSQHCAKCLIGKYDDRIKEKVFPIDLKNEIYYLCGVAFPFKWENNFHLAFMPCENENIYFNDKGIEILIEGAKILPISTTFIDKTDPNFNKKSYYTCRNWQFAHYFKKHLKN